MDPEEIRRGWAERTGEYSPRYYGVLGPNATSEAVREVLDGRVDRDGAILELGCSAGRHLAHLHEHGYADLHGVEINDAAFRVMADTFPGLAEDGTFHGGAIEDVVPGFGDDRFDAVFSVETLQHLHPASAWVFEEVVRIADDLVVTVENEGDREASGDPVPADRSADESSSADTPAGDRAVNYVNGEVPLYYRDWRRVFTRLGCDEVRTRRLDRDTLRAFRPTS